MIGVAILFSGFDFFTPPHGVMTVLIFIAGADSKAF
jgi:hypothetical protein